MGTRRVWVWIRGGWVWGRWDCLIFTGSIFLQLNIIEVVIKVYTYWVQ